MITGYFDMKQFFTALDEIRARRNTTWYRVFHETGVNYATLGKLKRGEQDGISIHTLATLCLWSGLDARPFMKQYEVSVI